MALFDIFKKKNQAPVQETAHSAIDNEIVKHEYVTLLDSILKKDVGLGIDPSLQYQAHRRYSNINPFVHRGQDAYKARMIAEIMTPEGKRFYPGEGISSREMSSLDRAARDAERQATYFPSDSLSTDMVNQLIEHGDLFK